MYNFNTKLNFFAIPKQIIDLFKIIIRFDKVVFVIRKDLEKDFKEVIANRLEKKVDDFAAEVAAQMAGN